MEQGNLNSQKIIDSAKHSEISKDQKRLNDLNDIKLFDKFRRDFGKKYRNQEEKSKRFQIFQRNLRKIEALNADEYDFATYVINKFADVDHTELTGCGIAANYSVQPSNENLRRKNRKIMKLNVKGSEFDWRDQNVVTSVGI